MNYQQLLTELSTNQLENSLWFYSCEHYKKGNVSHYLLGLQDQFGLNINLILFCLWLDRQSLSIDISDFKTLDTICRDMDKDLIHPLRQQRKKYKSISPLNPIYQQLKGVEIKLEQYQIAILYTGFQTMIVKPAAIPDNTQHILHTCKREFAADIKEHLRHILKE